MDYNSNFYNWFLSLEKQTKKEITNECKDYLVRTGKYDLWRKCQYAEYSKDVALAYGTDTFHNYDIYLGVDQQLSLFEQTCCKQIFDSYRKKVYRLRKKIEYQITTNNCVFLTLTFRDDVLQNTLHQTRRDYIRRFLKELGSTFGVANIDYGDKDKNPESKGREHYHAIVNLSSIDLSKYPYGFIYSEKIKKSSNPAKLAKYVNKLTMHSYKDSTKGCDRLIYLKNTRESCVC